MSFKIKRIHIMKLQDLKKRSEQFFCWKKRGLLSKKCDKQCNICFRYERNNKKIAHNVLVYG